MTEALKERCYMTTAQCSCGFRELGDEEIIDHLLLVFEPEDHRGNDGLVHEERDRLTCACGFVAITAEELDSHFMKAFTPDDAIGRDGKKHEDDYGA
jgi:hypothetical protein